MSPNETIRTTAMAALTSVQSAAHQFEEVNGNFDDTCSGILHHVLSVSKEANESYTFKEMSRQDDCDEFVIAMKKEIDDHTRRNHWEVILRSEMPKDMKIIMAIWSFKRKGSQMVG